MISLHSEKNLTHLFPTIPTDDLKEIKNHISTSKRLLYDNSLADQRPWVIAFSGGKDSIVISHLIRKSLNDQSICHLFKYQTIPTINTLKLNSKV